MAMYPTVNCFTSSFIQSQKIPDYINYALLDNMIPSDMSWWPVHLFHELVICHSSI